MAISYEKYLELKKGKEKTKFKSISYDEYIKKNNKNTASGLEPTKNIVEIPPVNTTLKNAYQPTNAYGPVPKEQQDEVTQIFNSYNPNYSTNMDNLYNQKAKYEAQYKDAVEQNKNRNIYDYSVPFKAGLPEYTNQNTIDLKNKLDNVNKRIAENELSVDKNGKIVLNDYQIDDLANTYLSGSVEDKDFFANFNQLSDDTKTKIYNRIDPEYREKEAKFQEMKKPISQGVYWSNNDGTETGLIKKDLEDKGIYTDERYNELVKLSNEYGRNQVSDADIAAGKVFNVIDSTIGATYRGYLNTKNDKELGRLIAEGKLDEAEQFMYNHPTFSPGQNPNYLNPDNPESVSSWYIEEKNSGVEKTGISSALDGAFGLIGQIGSQYTSPLTAITTTAGAVIGGVAGYFAPGLSIAQGAAKGAKYGANAGSAVEGGLAETAGSYRELRENGIDQELARDISMGVGFVNAGLEYMQLNKLGNLLKGGALSGSTKELVVSYVTNVLENTIQEVAQETVTISGTELGKAIKYSDENPDEDVNVLLKTLKNILSEETKDRLIETTKNSALSFAIIGAPGVMINGASATQQNLIAHDAKTLLDAGLTEAEVKEVLKSEGATNNEVVDILEQAKSITTEEQNGFQTLLQDAISKKEEQDTQSLNTKDNGKKDLEMDSQIQQNNNVATIEGIQSNLEELKTKKSLIKDATKQAQYDAKITALEQELEKVGKYTQDGTNNATEAKINTAQYLNKNNSVPQDIRNFAEQVDNRKRIGRDNDLVVLNNTPKLLQDIGAANNITIENRPITVTNHHIDTALTQKSEDNSHLHGLTEELVKQIPEALYRPLNVVKSDSRNDSIVVITELADHDGNLVVVPLKIENGKGVINKIEIDTNAMTSIYAKDNGYDNWIKRHIDKGLMLYDIDEGIKKGTRARLQLSRPNSFKQLDNTTNLSKSKVVLPINSNMQENAKDTPKRQNANIPMQKIGDVLKVKAEKIAKQINEKGDFDLNQRSWIETSTESDTLKGKIKVEDLDPNKITYQVQSNQKSVDEANKHIKNFGYDESIRDVKKMLKEGKLPSASDMALMERMVQEATKKGDYKTAQELIMDISILGTDLGQATQALSIIQRLTPEGQLKLYTKIVERAKARGEKSFEGVKITPEMVEKVLSVYKKDGTYDQNELNSKVEDFKQDIANQMKSTVGEKIDAWRYLAMLGNPKTHIRNIVSNLAMKVTIKVKNAMARTIETILPVKDRTKTWKRSSADVKKFAKQTANEMKGIITGEAKYNEKSALESKKQIFKFKPLEKISDFNGNALEAEDWFFSKSAFQNTLSEYLTANGITTTEDINNNSELVEKAKIYAVEQAEIATFRQYSKLAAKINQFERNSKVGKVAIEALMPFKKTPINVAKAGVKYSPLGLIKNVSYDVYQLQKGNINASQFIDNLSQGLTGTSLTMLGYVLAKAGVITASGGDDKEDKFDSQLGQSEYSIKIGDKYYSISWLSPVAMPLLVGANAYEQLEEDKEWDMNVVSDTLSKTLDPLNEMSFMQGLTNALQSYGSGTDKISGALESTAQNYVGQFFPTLLSQFAATIDDKKRSTKASANSSYKFGEQTLRSVMYKLPGLRQQLEPATDIWGNEKEQADNIIQRALENFITPYSRSDDKTTDLDKELKKVYSQTGNTGVIPSVPYAHIKYGDYTYYLSADEYTQYKKVYGQTAKKLLNETMSSSAYKNLSYDEKSGVIENILGYSKYAANKDYFAENQYTNKNYTKADLYSKVGKVSDYYLSKAKTFTADKDKEGKTISGSKKKKVINYINSLNMSIVEKAMLIKLQNEFTFNDYNSQIVNYVNSKNLSINDKKSILEALDFTVKDGKVSW